MIKLLMRVTAIVGGCFALGAPLLLWGSLWWNRGQFEDHLFEPDYEYQQLIVGTALRTSKGELFSRCFAVIVRDQQGNLVRTLDVGPGGFPEAPLRPKFVSANEGKVTYELEVGGTREFTITATAQEATINHSAAAN